MHIILFKKKTFLAMLHFCLVQCSVVQRRQNLSTLFRLIYRLLAWFSFVSHYTGCYWPIIPSFYWTKKAVLAQEESRDLPGYWLVVFCQVSWNLWDTVGKVRREVFTLDLESGDRLIGLFKNNIPQYILFDTSIRRLSRGNSVPPSSVRL